MKKHITNLYSLLQGKSRKVAWAVVPSVVLILFAFVISGCVKQKNCDYENTKVGKFVYLKEPYNSTNAVLGGLRLCPENKTIVAHFIYDERDIAIMGYIPHKFRVQDTVNVRVSLKGECHGIRTGDQVSIFSLKCIEKN